MAIIGALILAAAGTAATGLTLPLALHQWLTTEDPDRRGEARTLLAVAALFLAALATTITISRIL